jgi:hypothetical protein
VSRAICRVRSATLAAIVPQRQLCVIGGRDADSRRGELTTERAESSQGLPVLVVEGVAYGPGDLGDHEIVIWDRTEIPEDLARRAGYTVRTVRTVRESEVDATYVFVVARERISGVGWVIERRWVHDDGSPVADDLALDSSSPTGYRWTTGVAGAPLWGRGRWTTEAEARAAAVALGLQVQS